jgi:hypothetical protein
MFHENFSSESVAAMSTPVKQAGTPVVSSNLQVRRKPVGSAPALPKPDINGSTGSLISAIEEVSEQHRELFNGERRRAFSQPPEFDATRIRVSKQTEARGTGERKKLKRRPVGAVLVGSGESKSVDLGNGTTRPLDAHLEELIQVKLRSQSQSQNGVRDDVAPAEEFNELTIDDALKELGGEDLDQQNSSEKVLTNISPIPPSQDIAGLTPVTPLKIRTNLVPRKSVSPNLHKDKLVVSATSNTLPASSLNQSSNPPASRRVPVTQTNVVTFPMSSAGFTTNAIADELLTSPEIIPSRGSDPIEKHSSTSTYWTYRILKYSKDLYLSSFPDENNMYHGRTGPSYYVEVDLDDISTEFTLRFHENSSEVMKIEKVNSKTRPGAVDSYIVKFTSLENAGLEPLTATRLDLSDYGNQYTMKTNFAQKKKQWFVGNRTQIKQHTAHSSSQGSKKGGSFGVSVVVDPREIRFYSQQEDDYTVSLASLKRRKRAADRLVDKMKRFSGTSHHEDSHSLMTEQDQKDNDIFGWLYIYPSIEEEDPQMWNLVLGLTLAMGLAQRLEDKAETKRAV